jgi:hypothetical protein
MPRTPVLIFELLYQTSKLSVMSDSIRKFFKSKSGGENQPL